MIKPTRQPMGEQPPGNRIHNFDEVALGYTPEQAMEEATRCLQCAKPGCVAGCPIHIEIPRFLEQTAAGDFKGGYETILNSSHFPAVCGRVCPQERQCEGNCVLAKKYEPVAIGRIERFLADHHHTNPIFLIPPAMTSPVRKVAVAGAGPAGLTVAAELAIKGYSVTVLEALHEPGGVLSYGIPEFCLPKSVISNTINEILNLGVDLRLDTVVGLTVSLEELLADHDAVFLGIGAGRPLFPNLPGEELGGVFSANEYLTRVNLMQARRFPEFDTPVSHGKRVLTIGGGNTAIDTARTALRLGASESLIIYRRSRSEMPARAEEVLHAEEEGVQFHFLTSPTAFLGSKGRLVSVECVRNELGEPDESGRRSPVSIPGSNFALPADIAILAIGQSVNPIATRDTMGIHIGKDNLVLVDPDTMKTSLKGVFAAGDAISGGATVSKAIGEARIAAREIDAYLNSGEW